MATPLHPDPSRRVRPVMTGEVREMRALVAKGLAATRIGIMLERSHHTVKRHCPETPSRRRPARYAEILAYKERTGISNTALAWRFGYSDGASVAVILCRARKLRAAGRLS